jgi:hypothetical protein
MPPSGRLDPAVYQTIGQCYAEVARIEGVLDRAVPVVEAAIVVGGHPLDEIAGAQVTTGTPENDSVYGLTRLLTEQHLQIDIVEVDADLERYRLLVLPDNLAVDAATADRLRAYLANGGAIVACSGSLCLNGGDAIWADALELVDRGVSPFAPAFLKFQPQSGLFDDLPDYEYALYDGSRQWRPANAGLVLARLGEPLFQRSPAHYTSHAQSPFDHLTDNAAVVLRGRLAAIAFPIGSSYHRHGYWIYREIVHRLVRAVLPQPLIRTNAPISTEVTLTHQAAASDRPERWLVHVVNFSPNRRSPELCEYLEDPIPLTDIQVMLHLDRPLRRALTARDATPLPLRAVDHGWEVTVPRIRRGEVVVLEE